jgi:hypothetical protein
MPTPGSWSSVVPQACAAQGGPPAHIDDAPARLLNALVVDEQPTMKARGTRGVPPEPTL